MKIGKNMIKTSGGKVLHFSSPQKRDNWERVARAYKHGFKPKNY